MLPAWLFGDVTLLFVKLFNTGWTVFWVLACWGGDVKLALVWGGDFTAFWASLGDLTGEFALSIFRSKMSFVSVYLSLVDGWYWYVFSSFTGALVSAILFAFFPEVLLLVIDLGLVIKVYDLSWLFERDLSLPSFPLFLSSFLFGDKKPSPSRINCLDCWEALSSWVYLGLLGMLVKGFLMASLSSYLDFYTKSSNCKERSAWNWPFTWKTLCFSALCCLI